MSNNYFYYHVCMELKTPNDEGKKFNFTSPKATRDIVYAIKSFNKHFKPDRQIQLFEITPQNEIIFYFRIRVPNNTDANQINARQFSYLSKRLYHDKEWAMYTRTESTLLTATMFDLFVPDAKMVALFEDGDEDAAIPEEYRPTATEPDLSDEDAIKLLQSLFVIRDIGTGGMQRRRKDNIGKIKTLLLDSF
ncbi:hypothetical protein [Evansella tamaricis]|uniref:Uncharacterized protein n=1 Tax=Evansella tamaricis TaxID=2069301 RepID=A0ABS6JHR1_9BACI|nr:hypothetical protein [Evansella tamaricis]MBU9713204.1 hypothetical protein [Evansella tamaricis]